MDAGDLHAIRSDERIMKYIGRPRTTNLQDAIDLIDRVNNEFRESSGITWGMKLKGASELIGLIGLYRLKLEHYRGELGYTLHIDHWGKGFMSEAIQAVLKYSFEEVGFNSIEADTDPSNTRSMKVLERNGFKLEGQLRESFFFAGEFYDSAIWSMLKSDFCK